MSIMCGPASRNQLTSSSANGYGTGGIGGIYQVTNTTTSDCVLDFTTQTGSWPAGLATNTLPAASGGFSATSTPGTHLGAGAIAGIVIAAVIMLILVGIILWLLVRRKHRREVIENAPMKANVAGAVDLGSEDEDNSYTNPAPAPMIEPFPDTGTLRRPAPPSDSQSPRDDVTELLPSGNSQVGGSRASVEHTAASNSGNSDTSGPGVADTLPPKAPITLRNVQPPRSPITPRRSGMLHVVNHDDSSALPTFPAEEPRRSLERPSQEGPMFRRHMDAGRVRDEVVDLPPLYTEVPRDAPVQSSDASR